MACVHHLAQSHVHGSAGLVNSTASRPNRWCKSKLRLRRKHHCAIAFVCDTCGGQWGDVKQLCMVAWAVAFVMAAPVLLALTAWSACGRLAVEVASTAV